jgi:hypothetical protein
MKPIVAALAILALVVSCDVAPVHIEREPPNSSSSTSSSGQGNGGSDPGLPCDPCENMNGSRIVRQQTIITTQDGLRLFAPADYWDNERNEPCSMLLSESGTWRCLPSDSVIATAFSDYMCSYPIAVLPPNNCNKPTPVYAIVKVESSAPCVVPTHKVYPVGAVYDGQIYMRTNGDCVMTSKQPNFIYRTTGTKIFPDEFAEMKTEYVH